MVCILNVLVNIGIIIPLNEHLCILKHFLLKYICLIILNIFLIGDNLLLLLSSNLSFPDTLLSLMVLPVFFKFLFVMIMPPSIFVRFLFEAFTDTSAFVFNICCSLGKTSMKLSSLWASLIFTISTVNNFSKDDFGNYIQCRYSSLAPSFSSLLFSTLIFFFFSFFLISFLSTSSASSGSTTPCCSAPKYHSSSSLASPSKFNH